MPEVANLGEGEPRVATRAGHGAIEDDSEQKTRAAEQVLSIERRCDAAL